MSRVKCPFVLGSASTGGSTSAVTSVSNGDNLDLSSGETLPAGLFVVAYPAELLWWQS